MAMHIEKEIIMPRPFSGRDQRLSWKEEPSCPLICIWAADSQWQRQLHSSVGQRNAVWVL